MRKRICLLFFLFFLMSCGPSGGEPAAVNQEPTITPALLATATTEATAVPEPTTTSEPTAEPTTSGEETSTAPDAFSAGYSPATTVDEAAVVREQDWVRGAAEPMVTIIEYGDFQ